MRKNKVTAYFVAAGMIGLLGMTLPCLAEEKEERQQVVQMEESLVEGAKIAVVTRNATGGFWKTIKLGMESAIKDINEQYGFSKDKKISMTFEGPDGEAEVDGQINMIDAVLAENPDVLCLAANDMDSCEAQLENAIENGIPVIMFDADLNYELYTSFCGTDNKNVAKIATEKLAQAMGETGEILIFSHEKNSYTASQRVEGFEESIKEYPNMRIAEICYIDDGKDIRPSMKEALENHPDAKGVFCTNSIMANKYLAVQKEFKDRELFFVGVDANEEQRKAVQDGVELGIIAQQTYQMGYETICQAVTALGDGEIQKNILLDCVWLDKDNLEDPENAQYFEQ